jgi:hypothetical protein
MGWPNRTYSKEILNHQARRVYLSTVANKKYYS